jgi:hypothetical protein
MAVCPRCKGTMGQVEAVCPHCGYDFPPPAEPRSLPWWLHVGLLAAMVGVRWRSRTTPWWGSSSIF